MNQTPRCVISGTVESGNGFGSEYVKNLSKTHLVIKWFGVNPYPGTLKVSLSKPYNLIGLNSSNRNRGEPLFVPAQLGTEEVLLKWDSSFPSFIQIISPKCLRETMDIATGDIISVYVNNVFVKRLSPKLVLVHYQFKIRNLARKIVQRLLDS